MPTIWRKYEILPFGSGEAVSEQWEFGSSVGEIVAYLYGAGPIAPSDALVLVEAEAPNGQFIEIAEMIGGHNREAAAFRPRGMGRYRFRRAPSSAPIGVFIPVDYQVFVPDQ